MRTKVGPLQIRCVTCSKSQNTNEKDMGVCVLLAKMTVATMGWLSRSIGMWRCLKQAFNDKNASVFGMVYGRY